MVQWSPEAPKVLLVDDSPANLVALGAVLKPLGVQIVEARSGVEALSLLEHETFAVALVDVQMPGMDGFELARKIRALPTGAEMPLIFLTAIHRDELNAKQGYATGAADYVTKPFDPDVLRARVRAFVDLFRQRERLRAEEVSERIRERDDARREAEIASTAKDEFLATVSHELRTPLNAILGWSILARDMTSEPQVQRALATIERNARAEMRIIEDLLDVGRILSGKLRLEIGEVDVAEPIRGAALAVREAAHAKQVTLTIDVASDVGRIVADGARLQQIAWNLLSNAIKFTHAGGHVTLRVRREDGSIILAVEDDGEGIAPEVLPVLFQPFRQADSSMTRRHGGLGIGLAIADQLVQAHGGTLRAESPGVGQGATFTAVLPARSVPPPANEAASLRDRSDDGSNGGHGE
ncbi:MAG TPA: hybrid sensor histidine kinase/response regulator [Polyangiaceae bacterium]|nr:hybrid sensor histidine kinase/response regulator [Polyangiaceae bacterium]